MFKLPSFFAYFLLQVVHLLYHLGISLRKTILSFNPITFSFLIRNQISSKWRKKQFLVQEYLQKKRPLHMAIILDRDEAWSSIQNGHEELVKLLAWMANAQVAHVSVHDAEGYVKGSLDDLEMKITSVLDACLIDEHLYTKRKAEPAQVELPRSKRIHIRARLSEMREAIDSRAEGPLESEARHNGVGVECGNGTTQANYLSHLSKRAGGRSRQRSEELGSDSARGFSCKASRMAGHAGLSVDGPSGDACQGTGVMQVEVLSAADGKAALAEVAAALAIEQQDQHRRSRPKEHDKSSDKSCCREGEEREKCGKEQRSDKFREHDGRQEPRDVGGVEEPRPRVTERDIDACMASIGALSAEPELLLVFGKCLSLAGFSPWHTRLCEIRHMGTLNGITLPAFLQALDYYASTTQRLGK
eukprot:jgi/Mesen1/7027/ME000366S06240